MKIAKSLIFIIIFVISASKYINIFGSFIFFREFEISKIYIFWNLLPMEKLSTRNLMMVLKKRFTLIQIIIIDMIYFFFIDPLD